MTDPAPILAAARFAADRHHGQVWKGVDGVPYVAHVLDVAERLAAVHPGDAVLIVAGLLHDTVEDTGTTEAALRERFGRVVAALVAEVTDDPSLPEGARRAAQVEHVRHASDRAKRLKLADKASNLAMLARTPPDWSEGRMAAYVDWALAVVEPVRGLDPALEVAFDAAVARARAAAAARPKRIG